MKFAYKGRGCKASGSVISRHTRGKATLLSFILFSSFLVLLPLPSAQAAIPSIASISEKFGPKTGGTTTSITGLNFTGSTGVTIGGVSATINSLSDTTISITTPVSATNGYKNVVILNPDGNATLVNGFHYYDTSVSCGTSGAFHITNNGVIVGANCIGTVQVPEGVTTIGSCSLGNGGPGGNCVPLAGNAITAVTLPSTLVTIDPFAFLGATTMTSVNLPEGLTTIGNSAFYASGKHSINIPTTVTSIGSAFYRSNVNAVTFSSPSSLRIIPNSTFRVMPNLTSITLPEGVTTIQSIAFAAEAGSQVLKWISLPSTITTVDTSTNSAFLSQTLTCLVNPGNTAFINGLTLPGSPTKVSSYSNCPAPTISTISANSGTTQGGVLTSIGGTNLLTVNTVTIDGTPAAISARTATSLSFTTPAGTVGAKDVVITTLGHTVTSSGGYTYLPLPTITSLSVTSGTIAGGTVTVITGTNLGSVTSATLGGAAVTRGSNTATSLSITTPASTAGSKQLVITNANGTVSFDDAFTYFEIISSFSVFSLTGTPRSVTAGSSQTITATVAYASKITFRYRNVRIPRCISLRTPLNAPFTITCTWKASRIGAGQLTATSVPNAGGISTGIATPINVSVVSRATR